MTGPAGIPDAAAATVSVRGEATIEADPEIVVFSVSVSARARDRRDALANLPQRNDEFLAAEYAEAVGGRLIGLIELADTGMGPGSPMPAFAAARGKAAPGEEASAVIDMEPESQVVQASVDARLTMTQPGSLRA